MPASALLVRDRVTWLIYLQLATYGYFLYSFTPSVTLLRDDEHTSRAVSGLHGTALAAGAVAAGILTPRLVDRFGRARLMRGSLVVLAAAIAVFISCSIVAVTLAGAAVAGFAGAIIVNLSAAMLTHHHPGQAGGAAVSEANGVGSGFGIFAPLLLSAAIALKIGWRAGLVVAIVLALTVAVLGRGIGEHDVGTPTRRAGDIRPPLSREFWRAWLVLVLTAAIEFSLTIWSSDVLEHHQHLSEGVAATGVTAIVCGMTIGRLTSSRLALRYSADTLLVSVFLLTLVGFTAFWFTSVALLAFVGLFVIGLGISLQFPLAITRVIEFSDGQADLATGHGAWGTGLAIGLAPFGLGALADHVGTHTAMLIVPVFVVVAVLGVTTAKRRPLRAYPRTEVGLAVGDIPGPID